MGTDRESSSDFDPLFGESEVHVQWYMEAIEKYGEVAHYFSDETLEKLNSDTGWAYNVNGPGWPGLHRLVEGGPDAEILQRLLDHGVRCQTDEVGRVTHLDMCACVENDPVDRLLEIAEPLRHVESLCVQRLDDDHDLLLSDAGLMSLSRWSKLKEFVMEEQQRITGRGLARLFLHHDERTGRTYIRRCA